MKWLLIALLLLFFVFWDFLWRAAGVTPIYPGELKKLLRSEDGALVLDVRTAREYRLFRIPGAVHRPDLIFSGKNGPEEGPGRPIVVVCMTGHRSPLAAKNVQKGSGRKVYHLAWGMLGYAAFGGRVESGSESR
jgi:rhodanese-related sulfurtransferase